MNQPPLHQAQCENELLCVNASYRAMLDLLEMVEVSQASFAAARFAKQLAEITALQAQLESQELTLQRALAEGTAQTPTMVKLLAEKKALIEEVRMRNQSITLQARAIQSYLQEELHQASAGYVALKGYRSSEHERSQGCISRSA